MTAEYDGRTASGPILEVRGVSKHFGSLAALDDVSVALNPGEIVGVVGESGSGKSTLGRIILGLERPDSGEVLFRHRPLPAQLRARIRAHGNKISAIQQDTYASIDPRYTISDVIAEPLRLIARDRKAVAARIADLLEQVGMGSVDPNTRAHSLSGGQLQRICIARALALDPQVIVCDEPTSALDVSVQGQVLNLLLELREQTGVAYLFITHNMQVVQRMSDRIVVMHEGAIVEQGAAREVVDHPAHPYTRTLLGAILGASPADRRLALKEPR